MNLEETKQKFKKQLNASIDKYTDEEQKCAFAAGMLLILSALKIKDGPTIPTQIVVMHKALREIGEERNWGIGRNDIGKS